MRKPVLLPCPSSSRADNSYVPFTIFTGFMAHLSVSPNNECRPHHEVKRKSARFRRV
jgi:hypothetical protein